jgi:hypothetical protein
MTDLEKRFHSVMGNMIANESLAASLDENAAGDLFAWTETVAKSIVSQTDGLDDSAAEEYIATRLRALRLMMRAIGRWVGEAKTLDAESRLALWTRVGDQTNVLFGESFTLPSMGDALARMPAGLDARQVIAWLKTFIG